MDARTPIEHGGSGGKRSRPRRTPKGRQLDLTAVAEVEALLGDRPRRRDLLIEHLHLIQDRYGHLSAAHLAALAAEMKLALAEVYEVATFYAHFDVVKEGETPPPPVTVRVCDSLSCAMAGAEHLLEMLPAKLGAERARRARAVHGRAAIARRSCAVGHVQVMQGGRRASVSAAARKARTRIRTSRKSDFAAYRAAGGYTLLGDCLYGKRTREDVDRGRRRCGPARPRRRGLSDRAQMDAWCARSRRRA